MKRILLALATALGVCASTASAAPPYRVLAATDSSLLAVHVETGEVVGRVPLTMQPTVLKQTADRSRIVVLHRGQGGDTFCCGFKPKQKSVATIIDGESLTVVARTELGWGLDESAVGVAGKRLTVYCPGYHSDDPKETKPREVVVVDLQDGSVAGRITLERAVKSVLLTSDGSQAVAFSSPEWPKKQPVIPAQAVIIDLSKPSITTTLRVDDDPAELFWTPDETQLILFNARREAKKAPTMLASLQFLDARAGALARMELDGDPAQLMLSSDGKYLYLLDKGKVDKKPQNSVNGRLQVVSLATKTVVASWDAGREPRIVPLEGDRRELLLHTRGSANSAASSAGELRLIRDSEIAGTARVPADAHTFHLTPDQQRLYVVGCERITRIDLGTFSVVTETAFARENSGVCAETSEPSFQEGVFGETPDGGRILAAIGGSDKLRIFETEKLKPIADVSVGRKSVKFGKFLGAAAMAAVGNLRNPNYYGHIDPNDMSFMQNRSTYLAFRPDGKYAYVMYQHTNDVTIVDIEAAKTISKINEAGLRMEMLPGDSILALYGEGDPQLIDTAKNKLLEGLTFPGYKARVTLLRPKDSQRALLIGGEDLYCLDGPSGKVVYHLGDMDNIRSFLLEQPVPIQEEVKNPE